jgi:4-amino-4-deoxy-L-arabinose transferase-like glycosyltransferase
MQPARARRRSFACRRDSILRATKARHELSNKRKLEGFTTEVRAESESSRSGYLVVGGALSLVACLAIYVALVFEHLTRFPLYFFCDEAVTGVDAHAILTTGADYYGEPWPVFFRGLGDYALSLSVYWAAPFVYAFGLTEFAVRAATASASVIGVIAVYLLVRFVFGLRAAWIAFPLFATTPTWYLHSRTGFEYVLATSCFLSFALCYLLAMRRGGAWAAVAGAAAAACFYAYTPARGWIAASLALLSLVNVRDNLRNWRSLTVGSVVFIALVAPALWVHWKSPATAMKRLHAVHFDAFAQQSLDRQVWQVFANYRAGLDPRFWYTVNAPDRAGPRQRHIVPGMPRLPAWSEPLALLGIVMLPARRRWLELRTLGALLAAALLPASLVGFDDARAMPVGALFLVLTLVGIGDVWRLLEGSPRLERLARCVVIAAFGIQAWMFHRYVAEIAPTSYGDYGFGGLQMGAPEIFGWIAENQHPYSEVVVSNEAFNAGSIFIPFFLKGEAERKTVIRELAALCWRGAPPRADAVYVSRAGAFEALTSRGCPIRERLLSTVKDPLGRPLFEMATMERDATFDEWLERDRERRFAPLRSKVTHAGGSLDVEHPAFDIGDVQAIFDRDPMTLARSARVNPTRILIHLEPHDLTGIDVTVSHTTNEEVSVRTRSSERNLDWGTDRFIGANGENRTLHFRPPEAAQQVTEIEVVLHLLGVGDDGYVHVNEIGWE